MILGLRAITTAVPQRAAVYVHQRLSVSTRTELLRACSARQQRLPLQVRCYAGDHSSKSIAHHSKDDHHKEEPESAVYKEEYLELARNWPQNYYSPDNRNINIVDPEDFMDPRPPPTGFDAVNSGKDPEPETWSSPMWSRILVVGVSLAVAYRTNEYYMEGKQPSEHPVAVFLQSVVDKYTDPQVARDFDARSLSLRRQWADDRLIFASKAIDPDDRLAPIRISYVDMHTSGSDRLVDVAPDIDFTDVVYKTNWRDTKYVLPAYPKNKA
ncbi:hypothetical protein BASA50_009889 [Batrachochytrium salamandrivorans]|uniref:Mitochondrial import inner membrane translocase subunit Tim21 n=1 Tax=Batrachochytrium salamandrivorans TaxID=1357716 RepID=A0ABQ8F025_9FUNG|nr:hypothetical protein BASA62_004937 [Batrachochytrium salamandrivorans]KAH6578898.1 hypothetical protein BASA60_003486 [Batrachochytrium salamandrivorans]KAH6580675.1 hypothetical protein BASA61_009487 [Batrachochytrium salamandrivorans]KAH6589632.1 hypothetical protein BASA50_009889 [Batrachochytrium salamandrivorans]KAH9252807.1 hypothetical protein BASA81_009212 [Batrachochytrium salamandrivorans]